MPREAGQQRVTTSLKVSWEARQDAAPPRYRYWCQQCGRFVKTASVTTTYSRWDGERTDRGACSVDGDVEVGWGPL
jgi:hypothetical protein